ncbi:MAG: hypothetical protein ABIP94_20585, partial [Planctomycetota bacterium]
MNTRLRTTLAATLLVALVPEMVSAQATDPASSLLRAKVLEEQEGDLKAAELAYRGLLDAVTTGPVQAEAALRLGSMLWRLDRKHDATPFLERATAAGGDGAAQATAVLKGQGEAGKQAQERLGRAKALVERVLNLYPRGQAAQAELSEAERELTWLGEAAATALSDRLLALR